MLAELKQQRYRVATQAIANRGGAMNLITGKHLARRTFLKGAGASVALPFLDAMVPAGRPARDPAEGFTRMIAVQDCFGNAGGNLWGETQYLFAPKKVGRDFEIGPNSSLGQLAEYRDYLTVISNTDCRMAEPFTSLEVGGDHDRSVSVFLTQAHPKQTQVDVFLSQSLDQVHADRVGRDS